MLIYTNSNYEIISIDTEPEGYSHVFESDKKRKELFGSLCDTVIMGYKYEPAYEFLFNKDGSNKRDEVSGELLYKTDEDGNKIQNGYTYYPFVEYKTLILIQKQYEDSQKQIQALKAQIKSLSMISKIVTESN